MHYEYAVEPAAIAADWKTCKYLSEKFGFDRGRLLSLFPSKWFKIAHHEAAHLPEVEKKRIVEALIRLKNRASIRTGRPYDPGLGDWVASALADHKRQPFRGIIAKERNSNAEAIIPVDDVEDDHPLIAAPTSKAINRDAPSISAAVSQLLQHANRIVFVDAFFDPFSPRYRSTLRACLDIVAKENSGATCEIHYRYHPNKACQTEIEREAAQLFRGTIPDGLRISVYCWKEKQGAADFHARYLLTEKGGISVDAGFSAEGSHQNTDMHLIAQALCQERLVMFDRAATAFELVAPILTIDSTGAVARV